MPRDGSNIYHRPAGTDGIPDTPVESAKYNAYTADVEQDLNLPRPIVAGGTGATNAVDAITALGGELSNQIITNYDSDPIIPGSFNSAASATASPVAGHAFYGFAYGIAGGGLIIEARDISDTNNPHTKYVRSLAAGGSWTPWTVDGRTVIGTSEGIGGATANMFFGVTGVSPNSAFIVNSKADASGTNVLAVTQAGVATVPGPLNAGVITGSGTISAFGDVFAGVGGATGVYRFGNVASNYLFYDGAKFNFNGGSVNAEQFVAGTMSLNPTNYAVTDGTNYIIRTNGGVYFGNPAGTNWGSFTSGGLTLYGTGTFSTPGNVFAANYFSSGGVVYLNSANSRYLQFDGSRYQLPSSPLGIGYPVAAGDAARVDWVGANYQGALGFTPVQQSGGASQQTNKIYIGWDGAGVRVQVDSSDMGRIATERGAGPGATGYRYVYVADWGYNSNSQGMAETSPSGCVFTGFGLTYPTGNGTYNFRLRQLQVLLNGAWAAVGFAS